MYENDKELDKKEDALGAEKDVGLTLEEFTRFFTEMLYQPKWRKQADKEMDYKDGNQLDSAILQEMARIGIPPAVEPLIGQTIESILGAQAKKRTDWRVIVDDDGEGQEVADAYNYKLNQAERRSRADRSCSDAYESQVSVGIGWVEVARESNPFLFPYVCRPIHRNEIWWDFTGKRDAMLSDSRYLIRTKWVDKEIAILKFPDKKDLLQNTMSGWPGMNFNMGMSTDGGHSTGLHHAADQERGWSIEEQEWRDIHHNRIRLFEVWYRRWEEVLVLSDLSGYVTEFDQDDQEHMAMIENGASLKKIIVSKVRLSWWAGCHRLLDTPSPYKHNHFPYVPFWGHREDRTGVPFGRIRGMMYQQDNVNSTVARIRWGLAAVRTIRTEGAVVGSNERFRTNIARPDADIVLDADSMARPGAVFKVERDFQLSQQQYQMLADARASIQKSGGISNEFQGIQGQSTSGVQFNSQVEQSQQSLANIDDNFDESRAHVGELLLSLIIQDEMKKPMSVTIKGDLTRPDRTIELNKKVTDDDGNEYLSNDISRVMLKVVLNDVPTTSSYRNQQLVAMSEVYKSSPTNVQAAIMPHMIQLMDLPAKEEIVKAIQDANSAPSADQQEIARKMKELEIKQMMTEAQIKMANATAVKTMTEAQYAAMQGGAQVAQMPSIAPIADAIMQNAGYQDPTPGGVDPNFPVPVQQMTQEQQLAPQQNTSPQLPPVPSMPDSAMSGSETQRVTDNI